ncbi:MAG: MIP/aquaporin family protein [Candidatus Brocadiales bacterium]
MNDNFRRYVAEAIGTFALVFIGAGAVCTDYYLKSTGSAGIGLLGISLAFGFVVAAMVYATGYISGGHINPAVTVSMWATKRMDTNLAVFYIIFQLAGAAVAGFVLRSIYPDAVAGVHLGTTALAQGVPMARGILMEFVITFLLVLTVFSTAIDNRASKGFAGLAIGLAIFFGVLIGGPVTGGSMNPARTFGPAIASGFFVNHFIYWVGPILGGIAGSLFYERLLAEGPSPVARAAGRPKRR